MDRDAYIEALNAVRSAGSARQGRSARVIAESHIEEAALAWLRELGYSVAGGQDIAPGQP